MLASRAVDTGDDDSFVKQLRLKTKLPVLFEIVLSFEALAADVASVGDVVAVAAFVNHQVVGLHDRNGLV